LVNLWRAKNKKNIKKEGIEMQKRLQGIVIGFILAIFLTGTVAYAATGTKTLQASYNSIKIVIDGELITPKDAAGKVVEPFIADGTTYLPVRALATAFGKNVIWEQETNTVYIYSTVQDDYPEDAESSSK